jgi:general secretion pathway protein J
MALSSPRMDGQGQDEGFTLVEALAVLALTSLIVFSLGTVSAQWLPNWDRGFARLQRTDLLSLGLERLVGDLSAAEFVTADGLAKQPLFDGSASSVTLVRAALQPNAPPHLEIVRLTETMDNSEPALARLTTQFTPFAPDTFDVAKIRFSDPVILVRAPFRVSFSYAGADRTWRDTWRNLPQLPAAVRVSVRDSITDRILSVSTATLIHDNVSADCVRQKSFAQCLGGGQAPSPAGQPL